MDREERRWLLLVALAVLAGCVSEPAPSSPLLLPTRAPRTPTPAPTLVSAQFYYEAGLACQEAGDTECALQSLTQAIQIAPDLAPAYSARGAVYLARGQLDQTLADADEALDLDPSSAPAYALRGEALRLMGKPRLSSDAFDQAVALDPTLEEALFRSRWLVALEAEDASRLMKLSREYGEAHPDDPVRHYYRGWAFIEWGQPRVAVNILIEGIEATSEPPALLWFALGYAYLENQSWQEAVTSFEVALGMVGAGDTSLDLHSDQPVAELFGALGKAYLGAGRCADAETMLKHAIAIGAPASEYEAPLKEARVCQTPTPIPTLEVTESPSLQ